MTPLWKHTARLMQLITKWYEIGAARHKSLVPVQKAYNAGYTYARPYIAFTSCFYYHFWSSLILHLNLGYTLFPSSPFTAGAILVSHSAEFRVSYIAGTVVV